MTKEDALSVTLEERQALTACETFNVHEDDNSCCYVTQEELASLREETHSIAKSISEEVDRYFMSTEKNMALMFSDYNPGVHREHVVIFGNVIEECRKREYISSEIYMKMICLYRAIQKDYNMEK